MTSFASLKKRALKEKCYLCFRSGFDVTSPRWGPESWTLWNFCGRFSRTGRSRGCCSDVRLLCNCVADKSGASPRLRLRAPPLSPPSCGLKRHSSADLGPTTEELQLGGGSKLESKPPLRPPICVSTLRIEFSHG